MVLGSAGQLRGVGAWERSRGGAGRPVVPLDPLPAGRPPLSPLACLAHQCHIATPTHPPTARTHPPTHPSKQGGRAARADVHRGAAGAGG